MYLYIILHIQSKNTYQNSELAKLYIRMLQVTLVFFALLLILTVLQETLIYFEGRSPICAPVIYQVTFYILGIQTLVRLTPFPGFLGSDTLVKRDKQQTQ